MQRELIYDTRYTEGYITDDVMEDFRPKVDRAHGFLIERNGPGSESLGWMDLPENTDEDILGEIKTTANLLRENSDIIVVVGIGGSYLGAKALIESLATQDGIKRVRFAGYSMSSREMDVLLRELRDKDFSVNVVSKSGTTTEPAIAFRLLLSLLKEKYSPPEIKNRIVCTTDASRGALRTMAESEGYKTFVIPDDVGGRFSVLSPVGLFPAACAGIDINSLIEGAAFQRRSYLECSPADNASCQYAAVRNILYSSSKKIEILSFFEESFGYAAEWWRQLFGESEGKDGRGIFPSVCAFSSDLHSMGQLIQQGERNIFETFIISENESSSLVMPKDTQDLDGLNYLEGKNLGEINKRAYDAVAESHFEGGVPNSSIIIRENSPFCIGQLLFFFQAAAAVSAYISGVNPFDQPGVESYKKKMFKLLGKPGA